MRLPISYVTRLALLTSLTRPSVGFVATGSCQDHFRVSSRHETTRFMSGGRLDIKHVGFAEMKVLVEDYEELGRDATGMVIIDVRNPDEIIHTGKISANTISMPLPIIMQHGIFGLDEDDFEELTGIVKPSLDETIVFTCAAGIRSVYAANYAAQQGGYSKLVNYMGGAYEWFGPM